MYAGGFLRLAQVFQSTATRPRPPPWHPATLSYQAVYTSRNSMSQKGAGFHKIKKTCLETWHFGYASRTLGYTTHMRLIALELR